MYFFFASPERSWRKYLSDHARGASYWASLSNNNLVLLRALKMAVLSYYYFGEKTNDDALTLREEERQSQGPRYNVSSCARDCMSVIYRYIRVHTPDCRFSLYFSPLLSFVFDISSRTTDRTENIETPYVFPETQFIEAIMSAIRVKTKTSL